MPSPTDLKHEVYGECYPILKWICDNEEKEKEGKQGIIEITKKEGRKRVRKKTKKMRSPQEKEE